SAPWIGLPSKSLKGLATSRTRFRTGPSFAVSWRPRWTIPRYFSVRPCNMELRLVRDRGRARFGLRLRRVLALPHAPRQHALAEVDDLRRARLLDVVGDVMRQVGRHARHLPVARIEERRPAPALLRQVGKPLHDDQDELHETR